MSILCLGKSGYNIELSIDKNNKVTNKEEKIIGSSLVISYLLASWDENVYFEGIISNDVYGKKLIEELKSANVNIDYVVKDELENTSVTYKIIDAYGAKELKDETDNKESNLTINYKDDPRIIVSDLSELKITEKLFEKYHESIRISVINKFNNSVPKICKNSTYIIMSLKVAESITSVKVDINNKESLYNVYSSLKSFYKKSDIIIDIGNMGYLYEEKDKIKIINKIKSSYKKENKDVFYGSFIYGISNDLEIQKCMKIAVISEYLSSRNSNKSIFIPELESVYEIYKRNK